MTPPWKKGGIQGGFIKIQLIDILIKIEFVFKYFEKSILKGSICTG